MSMKRFFLSAARVQSLGFVLALLVSLGCAPAALAAPIQVVAAENFYGDVVRQIGGERVQVTSILNNPDQDPHLFEVNPSSARALRAAQLVVYNGIGYDTWMDKMLKASARNGQRVVLNVAALTRHQDGDNPHLWYDPQAVLTLARATASALTTIEPDARAEFSAALARFETALQPLLAQMAQIRAQHAGMPVTATEPVFGYMANALGFSMRHIAFQQAIMNDTEPAASDIIALESDLRQHRVRVLFYNSQAANRSAQRIKKIALDSGVLVLGVTETQPAATHYQDWMLGQLQALARQLVQVAP